MNRIQKITKILIRNSQYIVFSTLKTFQGIAPNSPVDSSKLNSYNSPIITNEIHKKYTLSLEKIEKGILKESSLKHLLPIILTNDKLRVLDIGGEVGSTYYIANLIKPDQIDKYAVLETEQFIQQAKIRSSNQLNFFGKLSDALDWLARCDVVIAGNSLQYLQNYHDVIGTIVRAKPQYILVSKVPLTENRIGFFANQTSLLSNNGPIKGLLTVQRDMKVTNRVFVEEKNKFLNLWKGYSMLLNIESHDKLYVDEEGPVNTFTYLFKIGEVM